MCFGVSGQCVSADDKLTSFRIAVEMPNFCVLCWYVKVPETLVKEADEGGEVEERLPQCLQVCEDGRDSGEQC